ncbi:hypothetical protein F4677DRAFT_299110 [Hypoxylon crocopeplum]|nr:hypothetical protein F4677DRAFT_299110 [Hypoxylon crocopeplum]
MVSFFGFKIGGEKKKKPANEVEASPTQLRRKNENGVLGEGQFIRKEGGKPTNFGNVYSVSRPDTSHSYKIKATRTKPSPYSSNAAHMAAMSMSELSKPNYSSMKHAASNPNLGNSWYNSSTPDLIPPVPLRNPSRPATPTKQQNWISPLEMHSTKGPVPPVASAPKSPLGQYQRNPDFASQPASFLGADIDGTKAPMPLRIRRPSPAPQPTERSQPRNQSPKKPPSPPQSIRTSEDTDDPVLGRPAPRDDIFRPSSRGSLRNMPTTLKEVQNAWDMWEYGPTSIPSPISTPRGSEEETSSGMSNIWGEPIIRTVGARRDTLTSIAPLRRSLEMKVEELEKSYVETPVFQRPKTSNGPQARRPMRPPPLKIDTRPRTPDRAGTYPPAPFMMNQRPQTPTGESSYRHARDRSGRPPAAVGAHGRSGRPGKPNTRGVHRPAVDEYEIQLQPQPQSHRVSQGSSNYDRPPSPDSPLMPLTGPLASPRFNPIESQLAPPPLKGAARFRTREPSPLRESPTPRDINSPSEDLTAPRLGYRNVPTPDSSDWPLPSPTASSFDTTAHSLRADSPALQTPPRVLPGVARAESPFGFRSFNFSRPMTPTLDQVPLRREIVMPPRPPRRSETVPVSPGYRDPDPDVSPSPGAPPPPRANTVTDRVGRGLRSPAIVGDDFGGGFI